MPRNAFQFFADVFAPIVAVLLSGFSEAAQDPSPLFDGRTLNGWMDIDGQPITRGWEVVDGMIHLKPSNERAGHIITAREFGDFEFRFEWKIAPGGNSGVKYRVRAYDGYLRGCEYQIIDDDHYHETVAPKNSAGALYDLYEPAPNKLLRPAGQFNAARIVVQGRCIEHWLNGRRVVSSVIGSIDWKRRVAASKFSEFPDFATHPRGRIMLTDHGAEVWYRNLEFRELEVAR